MIIFLYTFFVVLGGEATAAMCTTNLLEVSGDFSRNTMEDFVIEQDMVYTYDSFNL